MALVKAGLVGYYFMHVKFEGKWVYLTIIPAIFMAMVVVLGLVPDIALHQRSTHDTQPAAPVADAVAEPIPAS